MTVKVQYIVIMVILKCLALQFLVCQELNTTQQKYLEDIIEDLSQDAGEDADFTDVFNDLARYLINPLDLNSASPEELDRLKMLNNFQIAGLIEYKEKVGIIRSVFELGYLPGYREEDVNALLPFVKCGEPEQKFTHGKQIYKYIKNRAIIRYQRVFEKQAGYKSVNDSILIIDPDKTRYLGSPDKIYARYSFSLNDKLEGGIVMEKDAGEEFLKGSNRKGFDFYSAHFVYRNNKRFLRAIAIGDYHVQIGQGLLMWSSYANSKSIYITDISRRMAIIKGSLSADENQFLRGAAATLGIKKFSLTVYGSSHSIDASLSVDTSGINLFTGINESGYHNTPSEISKEKKLVLSLAGSSIRFDNNRLHVGINGVYTIFNKAPGVTESLYYKYIATESKFAGISADYKYLAGKTQFFGETSLSNNTFATLNGMIFYLTPEINMGIIHRYYQSYYYSHYANAFGENSEVSNEGGLFFGGEIKKNNYYFRFSSDVFAFPWLKYQVNAPSEGYEFMMELGYKLRNGDIYFRYKRQEKPENNPDNDNILSEILPFINESYRWNIQFLMEDIIKLQSRFEVSKAGFKDYTFNNGYLILQDLIFEKFSIPVDLILRMGYFNVSDYDARIYAYERDVLYAYTSQMFYGKGWRWMAMAKWQPSEAVTLYLKFAQSIYPGEEKTGNGLNEINSFHRSEIKFESVFRF